ncbi:MAG: SH3 domain-containing protein, partial [Clostridia bacterium]|nr:SH3 domain-containing protein [Clostridia bacterium]
TVTAEPHLNMREDHSVSSLSIAQIPANATITIVDVYHDANSTNPYAKYWGKTTYSGITGWVAMGYLK